ncbi:MAG: hypothetical protein P9M15_04365, partial [Candidatus Electryoneaceae bacterium]|nr:hypothetical protein [Candidatus Electryoneaceae bacterium]
MKKLILILLLFLVTPLIAQDLEDIVRDVTIAGREAENLILEQMVVPPEQEESIGDAYHQQLSQGMTIASESSSDPRLHLIRRLMQSML